MFTITMVKTYFDEGWSGLRDEARMSAPGKMEFESFPKSFRFNSLHKKFGSAEKNKSLA